MVLDLIYELYIYSAILQIALFKKRFEILIPFFCQKILKFKKHNHTIIFIRLCVEKLKGNPPNKKMKYVEIGR